MKPDRQKFCLRLKRARKEANLKQEHVAGYLELSVSAISALEAGSRKLDVLELHMLAKLYNKPVSWFLSDYG